MAETPCIKCEQARASAAEHGHRNPNGVCFDHAGIQWDEWMARLPAKDREEIERLADEMRAMAVR